MPNGGLSKLRLARMHEVLTGHVERGEVPGLVALVSRRGQTHVEVIGRKNAIWVLELWLGWWIG